MKKGFGTGTPWLAQGNVLGTCCTVTLNRILSVGTAKAAELFSLGKEAPEKERDSVLEVALIESMARTKLL